MYLLALRISELLDYSRKFKHAITIKDFSIHGDRLKVIIRSGKHSIQAFKYSIKANVALLWHTREYLALRGDKAGPLFRHPRGKPVTRNFFCQKLKKDLRSLGYKSKYYNCHSFRIGRASDLATEGASDRHIALIGRWRSDAFRSYIKPQDIRI